jgi:two-component system, NtrC family, sensor histidine kinase HydH
MCSPTGSRSTVFDVASHGRGRPLASLQVLLVAWLPATVVTVLHYLTGPEHPWGHDLLRRLYYLPILFAAFSSGLRGGLALAFAIAAVYSPHAFSHLGHHDPAHTLEKALELLLYLVVGGVAGLLVDRERARLAELEISARALRDALDEQRRTAEGLVRAGRLAALGELVAGIAHEIKNPLHAMRGTAEVLGPLVPEGTPERRLYELHLGEIERLGAVAERFLSFARPAPLERRPTDLRAVVERAVSLVEAQARGSRVKIVVEKGDGGGSRPTAPADEQQLAQVLLNLLINALQAIGEGGGRVTVSLREAVREGRRHFEIAVENSGPPVPEGDLERIFDPFVTTKPGGAGLGLSIASRIVEQHGGMLVASNLPEGKGVRFSVLLPA